MLYVRDLFFFYFLETVFDVCLIFVEENPKKTKPGCDKTTLDMFVCVCVCIALKRLRKEISVVLADAQTHLCTEPSCLMIDTLL